MNESDTPKWVSREDVEAIHEAVVDVGGGSSGLRDEGLLESALARPQNLYAYGENDTFQLAASYAEGIARNHPFVDGNKRTAFAAADLFLTDNGHNLDRAKGKEHAEMMEKLGQGEITREDAAGHFQQHSREIDRENAPTERSREIGSDEWFEHELQNERSNGSENTKDREDDRER